jgi:hypothetical protein
MSLSIRKKGPVQAKYHCIFIYLQHLTAFDRCSGEKLQKQVKCQKKNNDRILTEPQNYSGHIFFNKPKNSIQI